MLRVVQSLDLNRLQHEVEIYCHQTESGAEASITPVCCPEANGLQRK